MKEKSYPELMNSGAMNRKKEAFMLNLYIDMVLSESLLKSEKEKLSLQIDQAIDKQDKGTFLQLSTQYIELKQRFGT
ncbi:IDEAL domain-containing protein [Robertmurraya sp. DFI.2.37]|uniref:IDEAL domain-containing protein n=1 Tax=Robertmurraya sp. DFI.2.37 TaxID=3031819 RepID=UPI00124883F3|nr:IDEAL domain-containing protein [Robertmurraya sp. DFI.2.37]MDF1507368.1 IDEAL domain-containing protein [Robertmurraya sp. DFI.2.37]